MLEDKLRDEIIAAQNTQTQLAKWKLILIAGIVAAAFGAVPGGDRVDRQIALALIPVVCLYVDVLGFHASARIMRISRFFQTRALRPLGLVYLASTAESVAFDDYELYCESDRRHFAVEALAMMAITIAASTAVYLVGALPQLQTMLDAKFHLPIVTPAILEIAGGVGVSASLLFYLTHNREIQRIRRAVPASIITDKDSVKAALARLVPDWPYFASDGPIDLSPLASKDGDKLALSLAIRYASLTTRSLTIRRDSAPPKAVDAIVPASLASEARLPVLQTNRD